jgi:hypothetical protein
MERLQLSLMTLGLFLLLVSGPVSIGPVSQASAGGDCVPAPSGLVSWWPGDGNANDIVGTNHGTLHNGVTFAHGLAGQAFSIDGVDDYVLVPGHPSLITAGAFTVEFWFRPDTTHDFSTSRAPGFFSKGRDDSIGLANNDGRLEVRGPSPRPFTAIDSWLAGTWYHVTVTFDTTSYKIYVNGVQDGGVASTYSILNNTNDIMFGTIPGFSPAGVTFHGLVDEMSLYNRALSASEIQAIYLAGGEGKCKFTAVAIDIKPGGFPNSINLGSGGTVPVAILSAPGFDATTVNPTTVTLAGAQVKLKGKGTPMASFDEVNGDGLLDLVVHVSTEALQLSETDTEAILEGQTFGGTLIRGTDSVRIVP